MSRLHRAAPILALLTLVATWGRDISVPVALLVAVVLVAAVLTAVHHAEVVAHRVGEPFGSLLLAVAVTVIEVALIITLMTSGSAETATLARDTVFAAAMITVNGIVGLALMIGARKRDLAEFNAEGTGAMLACVATVATLCLILPTFTESEPGPEFTPAQLAFAAIASLTLYLLFVLTQTVRHRDFFLPVEQDSSPDEHAEPPTTRTALASLGFLVVSLVAVVGLAKVESAPIEDAVRALGLPATFVGVLIALLVLAPESIAAARAAARGRVQVGLNLGYGSAMASIGLTIPTLAVATLWLDGPLHLGLGSLQIVLLVISVLVGILTVVPGRATRLTASVHLALFAAYLFLSVSP